MHIASSLFLLYFLFPDTIFVIRGFALSKPIFLILLYVLIPVQMELWRLRKGTTFFLLRRYEAGRTAAYLWTVSGVVFLLLLTEMGLPQYIAAPCIVASAIGDPLLGELRHLHRRYTMGITFLAAFSVFYFFLVYRSPNPMGMIVVAMVAAGSTIMSESLHLQLVWGIRPEFFKDSLDRFKWLKKLDITKQVIHADDNMLILIGPAIVMITAYLLAGFYSWNLFPPPDTAMIREMAEPFFRI